MPEGGLNIRLHDTVLGMEARLQDYKRDAMIAFARANRLNRTIISGGRKPRIGVITIGKSYLDVRQALDELGLDEVRCNDFGLRLYKVGCPYPIGRADMLEFARRARPRHRGRGEALADRGAVARGAVRLRQSAGVHRQDATSRATGCSRSRARSMPTTSPSASANGCNGSRRPRRSAARVARSRRRSACSPTTQDVAVRTPYFCSGCPHNSSTVVPEGSRAYAGIGCHYMVQWMDRSTLGFTHMGGEGANWIGEAPFSTRNHVFQNIGDGTYNHSGAMAIRAAIASGVNITYKILYNDAVAMTGGQKNDGGLSVPQIAREMAAEGAKRVVVVTDEPHKYPSGTQWPKGLTIHHRDDLQAVQKDLAQIPGCTVLIYDQTCAAEKRRRRKRGLVSRSRPARDHQRAGVRGLRRLRRAVELRVGAAARDRVRPQAHDRPVELQQGLLLRQGLLPVLRHRGRRNAQDRALAPTTPDDLPLPPEPELPAIERTYNVIVTGIGGTGIVTVGAIIGMAAHLEGKGVGVIDMAGLAQKGGAVQSHLRIAIGREDIHSIRIAARGADLVLGGDIVVAGNKKVLAAVKPGATAMVINTAEMLPGEFTRNADFSLPSERLRRAIVAAAGEGQSHFVDASRLATALLGQSLGANMFLLGYAYQIGALPLSAAAIERALELNGEAVATNVAAFRWGRRAAVDARGGRIAGAPAGGERPGTPPVAVVRGDGGTARRLPRRLSGCRLCGEIPQPGRASEGDRGSEGAGKPRTRRCGCSQSFQAPGLQGRVRSRPALCRYNPSHSRYATRSAATTCASMSTWRRRCSPASTRSVACRARWCSGHGSFPCSESWPSSSGCAVRASIRSAGRPSAGPNDG